MPCASSRDRSQNGLQCAGNDAAMFDVRVDELQITSEVTPVRAPTLSPSRGTEVSRYRSGHWIRRGPADLRQSADRTDRLGRSAAWFSWTVCVQNKIFRGDRGCRNALPGLELLAIAVDQGDASHRHLKDGLGKPRDAVKGVLGLGVQHLITVKRGKPGVFSANVAVGHGTHSCSAGTH